MKPLGFLISLLVHLLLLLLVITVRFPLIELDLKPQIIQIVPMSPPPIDSQPLRAPAAVYVRPFVLKGGARGNARGQVSGPGAGAKAGLSPSPVSKKGNAAPAARPMPPEPGMTPAAASGSGVADATGKRSKLTVNLDLVSQRLRESKKASERSGHAGFVTDPAVAGLPFGDPSTGGESGDVSPAGGVSPAGEVSPSGDGTSSHALGGNAFFDSRGYDITPWAKRMVYRVKKNWISPPVSEYGLKGVVGIYLRIGRDGAIGNIYIRKTSGIRPFDQAAFNAIELSAPLPPLPADFPNADLPAYLLFYYN
jgi:hypothetical protein